MVVAALFGAVRVQHVVVDNLRTDPWSIVAGIAAIVAAGVGIGAFRVAILSFRQAQRQTKLAEDTFKAAKDELELATQQLQETKTATRQTQGALSLGRQQLEYMKKAELDKIRQIAPYVTASMKWESRLNGWVMEIHNAGGLARHLLVTGFDPMGQHHRVDIPTLDRGETREVVEFFALQLRYCADVRIRAWDVYDNKYITEYRGLSDTLAYDIYRRPWLDETIEQRPERCSEEVSWEVAFFERAPGLEPEPVEEGFNIDAPV